MILNVYKIKVVSILGLLDKNNKERLEVSSNDELYLFKKVDEHIYSILIKLDEYVWVITRIHQDFIDSMILVKIEFPDDLMPDVLESFNELKNVVTNKRPIKI